MKRIVGTMCALALALCTVAAAAEVNVVAPFNVKDLSGWKVRGPEANSA